jgi:hypothetical protein
MGVLGVALGLAGLPAAARAQAPAADTTPPTVTVTSPTEGAVYTQGAPVAVSFACFDDVAVASCTGSTANAALLDTATLGPGTFTVTAKDTSDHQVVETRHYTVVVADSDPGDIGGEAPATLTLTLGQGAAFAPIIPGVPKDYTATMTARVVSTAADAQLTVSDPSATATGHLVNGTYVLPQALKASATSPTGTGFPLAEVGGSASPTPLLTWGGPAIDDVALTFVQGIGATDPLRTGGYAKTLTFTLSTTNP